MTENILKELNLIDDKINSNVLILFANNYLNLTFNL